MHVSVDRQPRHRLADGRVAGRLFCAAVLAVASACGDSSARIGLPPLPPVPDASVDSGGIPDGGQPCDQDEECDDGIDCSRDECLGGRYCIHASDHARCSDGVYCNGDEVCDPGVGCSASVKRSCSDDDVCTIDSCDEAGKRCVNAPRDFDGDGEADWHCANGTDCDDFDATRASAVAEICDDGIDNDCDDEIDETSNCGQPQHDQCDDPFYIGASGTYVVSLAGAAPDYQLGCETSSISDVVFAFTIDEAQDVSLTATGLLGDSTEENAAIGLRTSCADVATERECSSGFPGSVRVRALPPGTYFAIVNSKLSDQLVLEVRFDPPTERPTNTTCRRPLDVSEGGRFEGNLVDVGDEEDIACGFSGANDLTYVFTTTEERDVELSAMSVTGERMNVAVRTKCGDAASTLRCISASPARGRMHQLQAGTYYVVLESSPSREVDFAFEVAFFDPTPPPQGDSCGDPLPLPLDVKQSGTLANRQDLVDVICGCDETDPGATCSTYFSDAVYRVTLDKAGDLAVHVDGGSSPLVYDLRSTCDDGASQVSCGDGSLVDSRIRDLAAGDYYLIIESSEAANFTVSIEALPRTMPVAVGGNDSCAEAIDVPEAGGVFKGDTLTLRDDYRARCGGGALSKDATFRLKLTQRSRVQASLEAIFDTVLYRFTDDGSGADSCASLTESICNDDGGQGNSNSLLDEKLDAGIYYYVVDGFNETNESKYQFAVTVTPE